MEPSRLHRGFTLIELMVVLAIIVVITSVVFTSQNSFNKTLVLSNTAYDIALTLRSTQTYGLSSRASGAASNVGYGIHLASGTRNSFIFFADTKPDASCSTPDCKPGDRIYASTGVNTDTLVQTYRLNNGITVGDFCAYPPSGSGSCASGSLTALDIVFTRPNPNALISGSNGASYMTYSSACITISSQQGDTKRYISIAASGQIVANASPCP
ncbi:MAG: prepilin-type N-terminal cleavage/methylation domain-containing protein [Candidatus Parcubacteria bacterium]|nr:prepilin-type N-terminal cleavage/methylation domain-containing protein [Candidatus Parcubacteria bacterium]